jgi:hypothetical protein
MGKPARSHWGDVLEAVVFSHKFAVNALEFVVRSLALEAKDRAQKSCATQLGVHAAPSVPTGRSRVRCGSAQLARKNPARTPPTYKEALKSKKVRKLSNLAFSKVRFVVAGTALSNFSRRIICCTPIAPDTTIPQFGRFISPDPIGFRDYLRGWCP